AVRLHRTTEMGATVRDDREARLAVEQSVVADVRRAARHFTEPRIDEVRRELPLALGEVRQRAEVDTVLELLAECRAERHHERRNGNDRADHAAESERRALEKTTARKS